MKPLYTSLRSSFAKVFFACQGIVKCLTRTTESLITCSSFNKELLSTHIKCPFCTNLRCSPSGKSLRESVINGS